MQALRVAREFTMKLLIATLAGALAVAGFAPIGISALAILSPVVLLLLWQRTSAAKPAALIGFAWGLGHFGAGVSWVYVSLHDIGMMPAPIAAIATLLFCAVLALYPAGVGYLHARLQARLGSSAVIGALCIIPAMWTLSEWLRGWIFTGFPWLALGYAQSDTPLSGFAPVVGVYGMSFAAMLAAGLIICAMGTRASRPTRAPPHPAKHPLLIL